MVSQALARILLAKQNEAHAQSPGVLPHVDLLTALNDPTLFKPLFNQHSWSQWKAFLATLFAQPLTEHQTKLYHDHTGRTTPPTQPFREAALIIGRRGGKSRILALIAVYLATFHDYSEYLAPGETPVVAIIAADRKQARVILRYCEGLLNAVPLLRPMIQRSDAETIELSNGVVIEIHTGRIAAPRGRTFVAVLCDEIAYWRSDDSANPDVEVINAVRPGLISIPNSMLLMASSPYAKRGVLWNTFRRHYGMNDASVLVWKASTLDMNRLADASVIHEAFEEDPAAAAAEFGADFRSDIDSYVAREIVDACTALGRHELPPLHMFSEQAASLSKSYQAFTDPSGGSSDSFTLAIAHKEGDIAVLDCIRERRPPFSPEATVADFAELLQSYGVHRIHGDRYGGDWPAERFREHGIQYEPSEKTKSELYKELLPLLNSHKVELLDNQRLAAQLVGLERRTARGGRDSIDHQPNAHDDLANVAAGVLVSVAGKANPLDVWMRL